MDAVLTGLAFASAVALAGLGTARLLDGHEPPWALGSAVALAIIVVAGTDISAVSRFQPELFAAIWAALALVGFGPVGRGGRPRWAPRRSSWTFLAIAALALVVPLLVLPVPFDTDAQGFGQLALAIRDGGTIDTLAPWRPGLAYLYSPGALLLFALASSIAPGPPVTAVMMGVAHACAFVFVWLAWELGREIGREAENAGGELARRVPNGVWPWAMTISATASVGLWTTLLDSHYTAVVGLVFTLAFVIALLRYARTGRLLDAAAACIVLAAVPASHADSALVLAFGFGPFLLLWWLARDRPRPGHWVVAGLAVPALAATLLLPWLVRIWPLVATGVTSPFAPSLSHWRALTLYHGIVWPALAVLGLLVSLPRRPAWALLMLGWFAAVVEVSTIGWAQRTFPDVLTPLLRFHYPFSTAWHGPVIPYVVLGAAALVWLVGRFRLASLPAPGMAGLAVAVGLACLAVGFAPRLLVLSRGRLAIHGAFASTDDLRAMRWIRGQADPDARVLNYPGDYERGRDWEAHWAPVVTERDCVYFRLQPFFIDRAGVTSANGPTDASALAAARHEQEELLGFWRDPADRANAALLERAGIRYVLVPESVGDPSSADRAWRWQPPALLPDVRSTPAQATYLQLVYRSGGAMVFEVKGRS